MLPVLLFLAGSLTGADPTATDASKKDLDKLQGVWQIQSRQEDGQDDKPRELGKVRITIAGNKITVDEDGMVSEGSFTIDAGKKPAQIDLVPPKADEGKNLGIYQVEGDTLKLCYGRPGADRPTEFATKAKSKHVLMIFKKEPAR